jgi:hypothetical protein
MNLLKWLCLLFLLIFFTNCAENSTREGIFVKTVKAQEGRFSENRSEPSDKDKLEIVNFLISIAKVNSKDICSEKQDIYFSTGELPKYVLENFPKKIKDCKTVLINENEIGKEFRHDYHRFGWWWLKGESNYVVFSTEFWGGNSGGGDYILEKKNDKWEIKSAEFSAAGH